MKQIIYKYYTIAVCIICMALVLGSCEIYNFSVPQPVDKKNIYQFPKDLRGYWVSADDSDLVILSNKNAGLVHKEVLHILNGAWPKFTGKAGLALPPLHTLQTIQFDSLFRPVDTIDNYLLRADKIYKIDADSLLEKGYPYYLNSDTIVINKSDTIWLDLGNNALLRQVDKNLYVLNFIINHFEEDHQWWRMIMLEENSDGSINYWDCSAKLKGLPGMFYEHGGNYYFDCKWSSEEILRLKKEGYFEKTSVLKKMER